MWDLRDKADLEELEGGLELNVSRMEWFLVTVANSETGWDWVLDPSGCNTKIFKTTDLESAPEWMIEDDDVAQYFNLIGVKPGECTFRIAYGLEDEIDWEAEEPDYDVITFEVTVVDDGKQNGKGT